MTREERIKMAVKTYALVFESVKDELPELTRTEQLEVANHIYKVNTMHEFYRKRG